ncbi:MAG: hypothetical protein AB8B50_18770 [Pirellulaceae bacterium]
MQENPYAAPEAPPQFAGITSGDLLDIRGVAVNQRRIQVCILVYLAAVFSRLLLPPQALPFVLAAVLVLGVVATVFVIMLATKVYPSPTGIIIGLLVLIPCVGGIVLLIVNGKATAVLRSNGFKVGLMGANTAKVEEAIRKKQQAQETAGDVSGQQRPSSAPSR